MADFGDHDLLWLVKIFADNILVGERYRLACPEYLLGLIRTHWSADVEKAFMTMASQIKERYKSQPAGGAGAGVNLSGQAVGAKSGGCC